MTCPVSKYSTTAAASRASTNDSRAIDTREHPLLAEPLDRVRRTLARAFGAGVDDVADPLGVEGQVMRPVF